MFFCKLLHEPLIWDYLENQGIVWIDCSTEILLSERIVCKFWLLVSEMKYLNMPFLHQFYHIYRRIIWFMDTFKCHKLSYMYYTYKGESFGSCQNKWNYFHVYNIRKDVNRCLFYRCTLYSVYLPCMPLNLWRTSNL